MTDPIARYYVEAENPDGVFLPGVPLSDIEQSRWDALPEWLRASADAMPCYMKTAPAARAVAASRAKDDDDRKGR